MQPLRPSFIVLFINQLVKLPSLFNHASQLQVFLRASSGNVCRFALHVLAVGRTVHKLVEFGAAVPAVHVNRFPVAFPQGVENLLHKGTQVLFRLKVRTVPEAPPDGSVAPEHFADAKVLHGS